MKERFSLHSLKNYLPTALVFLVLGLFFLLHAFLISKTFFIDEASKIRTAYSSYGDIPFHLTQVTKFAYGPLFDLTNPIYFGHTLQYPFLINLMSGLLLRLTGLFSFSIFAPVFLLLAGSYALLFLLYKKFLPNRSLATLGVILFFLGGGFGGYSALTDAFQNHFSPREFIGHISENNFSAVTQLDADYPDQPINYGAPLSLSFLHQRTSFAGLFFALLLFHILFFVTPESKKRYSVLSAILYGLLPIIHMHTFIAVSIVLFALFVVKMWRKEYVVAKEFVRIVFLGLLVALPQLFYLLSEKAVLGSTTGFLHFRFGWMSEAGIGGVAFPKDGGIFSNIFAYGKFLWMNFALLLPGFIASFFFLFRKKLWKGENDEKTFGLSFFALSGCILFFVVNLFRFQPWDYDNNKILIYFHLLAVPVILYFLTHIFESRKKVTNALLVVFSVITLFSGVIDLIPRYQKSFANLPVIFSADAVALGNFVKNSISPKSLVLTGDDFRNPVSSLAGRPVYLGYPGWLWSHGISYGGRENKLRAFYKNPTASSDIQKEFAFSYILVDDEVVRNFGASREKFAASFTKVFEAGQFTLYQK